MLYRRKRSSSDSCRPNLWTSSGVEISLVPRNRVVRFNSTGKYQDYLFIGCIPLILTSATYGLWYLLSSVVTCSHCFGTKLTEKHIVPTSKYQFQTRSVEGW
jgi:hypothetical protein